MKNRYYIYGLLVVVILFIAYNYYSAYRAEGNIDEIIQTEINDSGSAVAVQYSSIDVAPFAGNVTFDDLTVVQPETIRRAAGLKVDLSYYDFLKFNIGGTEYGLKHLSDGLLILTDVSYINRSTLAEVNVDTLRIRYSGNMWDAIQSYFTSQQPTHAHSIGLSGANVRYTKPQSAAGAFKVDSLQAGITIPEAANERAERPNTVRLSNITWTPPEEFQNKYAFFIQGFGFKLDSIPFTETHFSYTRNNEEIKIIDGRLSMKLFEAEYLGTVQTEPVFGFDPLTIAVTELSPQLKSVLQNVQKLFGISIPVQNGSVRFHLNGPVTNLNIVQDSLLQRF